jgi:hypothetical protein
MTCGHAVDGLGFYYIPHQTLPKHKSDNIDVLIRVIEGAMFTE